ncbi:hypothetical protein AXF42_Ash000479 [Apostasia shenzhenica]|uniref:Protein WVD2-like 7 n=1 Tax=Apostasia shenzhenica TaxID=1088818 RepID=A0A2I0AGH6_9ASPA|nr:hypothetical protein AXF42_Ash000479 [Apostasia shenzhenica]
MASDVEQSYYLWQHEELSEQEDSQVPCPSQMLDHGSISFGRFAFESLSWEKRSVFTFNERQEELERVKSPGLVAQKKAYFEEYYKKIRTSKALQENHQTEVTLEYGNDGSISSQTGDEDEAALPSPSSNAPPQNTNNVPAEDLKVEITFAREPYGTSKLGHGEIESLEETAAKITIKSHNSYNEMKQDKNCDDSIQLKFSKSETLAHKLSTDNSEDVNESNNHLKSKYVNSNSYASNKVPDVTPLVCPVTGNAVESDFRPADVPVMEKTKLTGNKFNVSRISTQPSKEGSSSSRSLIKSSVKSTSRGITPLRCSNPLWQNAMDKVEVKVTSRKSRSCDDYAVAASHGSLSADQLKGNIVRPVSLSNLRKGAMPNGTKELILRLHSKASNISASRKFNPEKNLRLQGNSNEIATHTPVGKGGLQSKSRSEELKNVVLDCKSSSQGRVAAGPEELKARSVNLPAKGGADRHAVTSPSAFASSGDKNKKANTSRSRKSEGMGSKITTPQQSGNIKLNTMQKQKYLATSHKPIPSHAGRKSFMRDSPLDGKKSRQEMPRWR